MDILTCHSRKTDHVIGVGVSLLLWGEGESEQAVGVVGILPRPSVLLFLVTVAYLECLDVCAVPFVHLLTAACLG